MGTFPSNIGLAVADFAKQKKVLFLAAEPLTDKIVWESGNHYTFRLRPSTYMQTAMLVPEAAKLKKKRWAIVYPNYEYGQSAAARLQGAAEGGAARRRVRRRAGAAARQDRRRRGGAGAGRREARRDLQRRCSAPTWPSSCARATRAACSRDARSFNLLAGEPEYLDPLKDETPERLVRHRLPLERDQDAGAQEVPRRPTRSEWNDYPRLGSVVGYSTVMSAVAAMKKAGSPDTEKLVAAMKGLQVDTPFGRSPTARSTTSRRWAPTSARSA